MLLAASKGIRFLLEQPAGSQAELHPRLEGFLRGRFPVYSCAIWHGVYGGDTPKRQKLYSNDERLLTGISSRAGQVAPGTFHNLRKASLVNKQRRPDGSVAWSGNPNLKDSQRLACDGSGLLFFLFHKRLWIIWDQSETSIDSGLIVLLLVATWPSFLPMRLPGMRRTCVPACLPPGPCSVFKSRMRRSRQQTLALPPRSSRAKQISSCFRPALSACIYILRSG